jgi:hypothetical protein
MEHLVQVCRAFGISDETQTEIKMQMIRGTKTSISCSSQYKIFASKLDAQYDSQHGQHGDNLIIQATISISNSVKLKMEGRDAGEPLMFRFEQGVVRGLYDG